MRLNNWIAQSLKIESRLLRSSAVRLCNFMGEYSENRKYFNEIFYYMLFYLFILMLSWISASYAIIDKLRVPNLPTDYVKRYIEVEDNILIFLIELNESGRIRFSDYVCLFMWFKMIVCTLLLFRFDICVSYFVHDILFLCQDKQFLKKKRVRKFGRLYFFFVEKF